MRGKESSGQTGIESPPSSHSSLVDGKCVSGRDDPVDFMLLFGVGTRAPSGVLQGGRTDVIDSPASVGLIDTFGG